MAEIVRYGLIGMEDLNIGSGSFTVTLPDGRRATLSKINLTNIQSATGETLVAMLAAGGEIIPTAQGGFGQDVSAASGNLIFINGTPVFVSTIVDVAAYYTGGVGTLLSPWTGWDSEITWTTGTAYWFRPGHYTGGVDLVSGMLLYGSGEQSILHLANSANRYAISIVDAAEYTDDVRILNLAIDGNKANNASGGGVYLNGRRNLVQGCYIYDTKNASILFGAPSDGATNTPDAGRSLITQNYLLNPSGATDNWGALAVVHGSHIQILDNIIESSEGYMTYGIDIEPNASNLIDDIMIKGNLVKGGRIFVDCNNLASNGTTIAVVENNVDARGSYGAGQENIAPIFLRKITNLQVTNNILRGHADGLRQGISVQANITNFLIAQNLILSEYTGGGNATGILFDNTTGMGAAGSVVNNTLIGSAAALPYGIYSYHATGLSDVRIGPNHFVNVTNPYVINSAGLDENGGTAASIADGGTIAHGLGTTPTKISVQSSVAGEMASVTGASATTITVAIKKHDNSAGTTQTIYWEAKV